jgi:hypothetical protein
MTQQAQHSTNKPQVNGGAVHPTHHATHIYSSELSECNYDELIWVVGRSINKWETTNE